MGLTIEEIRRWEPLSKMEHADEKLYKERVTGAYEVVLPHKKLTLIPYVGELPSKTIIEYTSEEVIGLCPVTFLPDIYKITLRYVPKDYVPELKSLKMYFMDFISLPISHEHIASKIFNEVEKQIRPQKIYLECKVNVRGGIYTTVELGDLTLRR